MDKKAQTRRFTNQEIAQLFENVAAALTLKGSNRFRITAYQNAQVAVEHATSSIYDLWEQHDLDAIPGFGETIQEYLDELFTTGQVKHFDTVFKGINPVIFEFLKLAGVGPKTAQKIADSGVKSIDDLRYKLDDPKVIKDLGEKTIEKLRQSVRDLGKKNDQPKRMLLPFAQSVADIIQSYLEKSKVARAIYPLGSLRRQVATIGDIDFAVASTDPKSIIDHFVKFPQFESIVDQGSDKASAMLKIGVRVDLMVTSPSDFGSLLQHLTGSKLHNVHLRRITKAKGISLSEKGIKNIGDDERPIMMSVKTEPEFYRKLGMDYIPPEIREDTGEIERAFAHDLPSLVELSDIKGDLHLHSSFPIEPSHDLGADTIETMIKRGEELGYTYLNFTEHNPSINNHTQEQILNLIKRKKSYIDKLNYSRRINVLNSLEIDILPNGELAVPTDGLKLLDLPVCSIHSKHNSPHDEITKRLLTALKNPYLKILGHPTNRLLNNRDESQIDWDVVFDVVKKNNKVLEVNAFPERLDLTDTLVREAVNRGIKLCIDTDSHAVEHMDLMRYGVSVARRGWAQKADIVNTYNWLDFRKFFGLQ